MTTGSPYPNLLSPLVVGAHTLRNRVVMGSMHTRLEYLDRATEREVAFYAERARGGVALIVSAGCAPNDEGRMEEGSHVLDSAADIGPHRAVTAAVHAHGAKMVLQILHAGRYAKHDRLVGPSDIASHINRRTPRAMSVDDIERTIDDYVRCAELARDAGYDGVEVMGSEGYLITEFTASRTNIRSDGWGGSLENRCRFPIEIVRRIRARLGPSFMIMFRISALDLVEGGLTGAETDFLARAIEEAGADALSTGVGWHEAAIPTISYHVPRAAWGFAVARLKKAVRIPVVASNRINMPAIAEALIAGGEADLVALARPMLADPEFVLKAASGRTDEINTCIACNQACLDYIFSARPVSCLVNPRAGRELDFRCEPATPRRRIAVVGGGPAGLACAVNAAMRGHAVTLFEAGARIGGQLELACRVPGKSEFGELLRYFRRQLEVHGAEIRTNARATAWGLVAEGFDHVVLATGVEPRMPDIPGIDHCKVAGYADILLGVREAGRRVAVIGSGGIAHDVTEFLLSRDHEVDPAGFYAEWGVDTELRCAGGMAVAHDPVGEREITMFQRGSGRPGARLGISTGWVLRSRMKRHHVHTVTGCTYRGIDDRGLHYRVDGVDHVADVDTVVICAGQEPVRALADELREHGIEASVIGGARFAGELDALRAIDEGVSLACSL